MCDNNFSYNLNEEKRTARSTKRKQVDDFSHQVVSLYQNKDWSHPNDSKDPNRSDVKSMDAHLKIQDKNKCQPWPHLYRKTVAKSASCGNQSSKCMECRLRNAVCASCVFMSSKHNLATQYLQIHRRIFKETEDVSKTIYEKSKESSKFNTSDYNTLIHIDGNTITKYVRQSGHSQSIDGKSNHVYSKDNETNSKCQQGTLKKTMIHIRLRCHRRCRNKNVLLNLSLHNKNQRDSNGKHLKRCKIYIKVGIPKKSNLQNELNNQVVNYVDKIIPGSFEPLNKYSMPHMANAEIPVGSEVLKKINTDMANYVHDPMFMESIVPVLYPNDLSITYPTYSSDGIVSPNQSNTQHLSTEFNNNIITDSANNIHFVSPDVNNIDYRKASFSNERCLNYNCERMTSNFSGVSFRNNMMIPQNFGNSGDNIRASELKLYENNIYLPCHPMMNDCGYNEKKASRDMCDSQQFFNGFNCIYNDGSCGTGIEKAICGSNSKTDGKFGTLLSPCNNFISNKVMQDCNCKSFANILSLQNNIEQLVNRNRSINNIFRQQSLFRTNRYKRRTSCRLRKMYGCNTIDWVIVRNAMTSAKRKRWAVDKNINTLYKGLVSNSKPVISKTDLDITSRLEKLQETKLEVWNSSVNDQSSLVGTSSQKYVSNVEINKASPIHSPVKATSVSSVSTLPKDRLPEKYSFSLYLFFTHYIGAIVQAYRRECRVSIPSLLQSIGYLVTITVFITIILVFAGTMLLTQKFTHSKPDKAAMLNNEYKTALKELGFD